MLLSKQAVFAKLTEQKVLLENIYLWKRYLVVNMTENSEVKT